MRKSDTEGFVPIASYVKLLNHQPLLSDLWLVEQEIYDLLYTLMQNEYTIPKLKHLP